MALIYLRETCVGSLDAREAWETAVTAATAWCFCHVVRAACAVRGVLT